MKSSEIISGVSYGIVPSWKYSSREARDPLKTSRNHVAKADLVSMDRYKYDVYRSGSSDDSAFERVADPKDRRFGYLVTDGNVFWVARPADIVDLWVTLEKRWAVEEEESRKRQEQIKAEQDRERVLIEEADQYAERLRQHLLPLIRNLTGRSESIIFSRNSYSDGSRVNPFVMAQLDARLLERLVERVLEAQEA